MTAIFEGPSGLCLRVIEESDLDTLRHLRNDAETWVHLTSPLPITAAMQAKWFAGGSATGFVAYDKTNPFIGLVRWDERDLLNRSVRIGADVARHLRGLGYGRRIYQTVLRYAFDYQNCHRVWLSVLATNERARHLYEKVGFAREGTQRDAVFRDGRWIDYVVMSMLEDEYRRLEESTVAMTGTTT